MNVAIYARVSTEEQSKEGTSLDSQVESCLKLARDKGFDVPEELIFKETYSGLSINRPKLDQLRELAREKKINKVIAYTLDRLSRDPNHYIIIVDGFERVGVELVLVTEDIDSSDLGRLISYIKGFAAKLEAEKIKERTMRGRRTRVEKLGKLPTGRGIIYGYTYNKKTGTNIATDSLDVIRMTGMWLLNEQISLNEICRRLIEKGIPAPKGGLKWSRSTIGRILRNPTYAGKTYAFKTQMKGNKRITRPIEERIELVDTVDRVAFTIEEWTAIQQQLDKNQALSPRNKKQDYLLRGMVYCSKDGDKYYGIPMHGYPYYRCRRHSNFIMNEKCHNKSVKAQALEGKVWDEVMKVLSKPELIMAKINSEQKDFNINNLKERYKQDKKQLDILDSAETRFLRLYGANVISEEKLVLECNRIKVEREKIRTSLNDLEKQMGRSNEKTLDIKRIKQICDKVKDNLTTLSFHEKRLVLEILNIKVWVDGDSITLQGYLPVPEGDIVSQPL